MPHTARCSDIAGANHTAAGSEQAPAARRSAFGIPPASTDHQHQAEQRIVRRTEPAQRDNVDQHRARQRRCLRGTQANSPAEHRARAAVARSNVAAGQRHRRPERVTKRRGEKSPCSSLAIRSLTVVGLLSFIVRDARTAIL